jgi:hypothetical protein
MLLTRPTNNAGYSLRTDRFWFENLFVTSEKQVGWRAALFVARSRYRQ